MADEIQQRNAYKKAVRRTKEVHVENQIQVQAMVEDGPWHRAWKMLAAKQTIRPTSYLIRKYFPGDYCTDESRQARESTLFGER